jgi:predicted nuclease of predicted toxin-antitoxin system
VDLLRAWGHDVITAREANSFDSSDKELLAMAMREDRILVTRDSDFGALVFLGKAPSSGVILLRITPETRVEVNEELGLLLRKHAEEDLRNSFSTVEPGRHRIRLVPAESRPPRMNI